MAEFKNKNGEQKVKDPEDNSCIHIYVEYNSEIGKMAPPGIHIVASGDILNFEAVHDEQGVYESKKKFHFDYLIDRESRLGYDDSYIKHYLLTGEKVNAKIAVKVRSKDTEIIKEYVLPFILED